MRSIKAFVAAIVVAIVVGVLIMRSGLQIEEAPISGSDRPLMLTIALTPTQDPDQLLISAKPLVDYLERELKLDVRIKTVTDYFSMVTALQGEHVDIAFMPGLPIVLSIEKAQCRPLCIQVQRQKTSYYSHIYVRADSPIQSLSDLKGRRIAFTDPVSSSGFLYPLSRFYEEGLLHKGDELNDFFEKVYWAGGYESALLSMFNGHVDASCGSQHAPDWYLDEKQRSEIRVLARAGPLPTHGIVGRLALGESFLNDVQKAFLKLNQPEFSPILKDLYHADGLQPATAETYASVLEKAQASGLFAEWLEPKIN